jgi:hypothetical protein
VGGYSFNLVEVLLLIEYYSSDEIFKFLKLETMLDFCCVCDTKDLICKVLRKTKCQVL